jgi:hypothetical protein
LHIRVLAILLALAAVRPTLAAEPSGHTPQLLLSAQRLRRLKRDRDRQTVRWVNFENRVKTVPDSPERGFELALYYAVTGDEARGKEAVAWARAHPCESRQAALVADWVGDLVSEAKCSAKSPAGGIGIRDATFSKIATGGDIASDIEGSKKSFVSWLVGGGFQDSVELYAACEYLMAARATQHIDLREEAAQFFSQLPIEFLLALDPGKLEHPDWMTRIAALALVALDPNLASSQYLQGWALEDRQTIREGPGVAYEFLWADPYLPGVGYQNMDTWVYDPVGRLFARSNWEANSCYIEISASGVQEKNCPLGWRDKPTAFGRLTLIPMAPPCVQLPRLANNEAAIVWKLAPQQKVNFWQGKQRELSAADSLGLWRASANVEGKVCLANR